jgi:hypothetical protein
VSDILSLSNLDRRFYCLARKRGLGPKFREVKKNFRAKYDKGRMDQRHAVGLIGALSCLLEILGPSNPQRDYERVGPLYY